MPLPPDLEGLPAWGFAFPGPLRDKLTRLALEGTKTTTAGLYVEVELGDDALPVIGAREVLLDSDERPVALIETVDCRVVRLADVDDRHAIDEGEGYAMRTSSASPTSGSGTATSTSSEPASATPVRAR